MPVFDAAAQAALGAGIIRPVWFGWLDFVGAPERATTAPASVTFAGTGDADLDGFTYSAIDGDFVDVSDVIQQEGGSDTVTVTLSGLLELDADTLAIIGDRSKWHGRTARLWMRIDDENGVQQGAVTPFYTGYMIDARILPSPELQVIQIQIENYLAAFGRASNRTYARQAEFDPADQSGRAALAAVNGASSGPGGGAFEGGGGGLIPSPVREFTVHQ